MTKKFTHPLHLSEICPTVPALSWQRPHDPDPWLTTPGSLTCPACHAPFAYDGPRNPCRFRCLACGEWLTWRATGERMERVELGEPLCLKCGAPMVKRSGKYGKFWGCSRWAKTKCKGKAGPRARVVVVEFSVELALWRESEPWEMNGMRARWEAREARLDAMKKRNLTYHAR